MAAISEFAWACRDARRFRNLPEERRRIVFYSEGRSYTKYLASVAAGLLRNHGATLAYLTSDPTDPVLAVENSRIDAFYIGVGSVRTLVFQRLRARVLVMTMPDLATFHIKRSSVHSVHYVYLHHSMVSTHMVYREGAFDHFDSVLCTGPHHLDEIRAWEKLRGLPQKQLFEHGYAPVDLLMEMKRSQAMPPGVDGGPLNVLLAPSWGPNGLLEAGAEPLVEALLRAGYRVNVRPHPRTVQVSGAKLNALCAHFKYHPGFTLDVDTASLQALVEAHVMISDWSGVAMEFAFGLERPVLFIDTRRKINNVCWTEIGITPLEVSYRCQIGAVVGAGYPADAPNMVRRLYESSEAIGERAKLLRTKFVFNAGNSGNCGAKIIADLAREPCAL
jgi:hypothetical protein